MQHPGEGFLVVGSGRDEKVGDGASALAGASHTGLRNTALELHHDGWWSRALQIKAGIQHSSEMHSVWR